MQIPPDLHYTDQHEWVRDEGEGTFRVGITDYAQDALGDVVFVDLPGSGTEVTAGDVVSEIESTKSVSEVFAPMPGTIVEVNAALADAPELVNRDPYGQGWFFVIQAEGAPEGLLDATAYGDLTT